MHIYRSFVHVQCSTNALNNIILLLHLAWRSYQPEKKKRNTVLYIRNQKLTNQIEHGAYVLCQRLTEKRRETWIEMIKLDCHCHRVHWWRRQLWRQILVNVLIIIVAVYLHALHLEMFCWMCALKIEIHPILMHCNASIHNEKKKSTRHRIMKRINLKRYRNDHSNFIRTLFCSRKRDWLMLLSISRFVLVVGGIFFSSIFFTVFHVICTRSSSHSHKSHHKLWQIKMMMLDAAPSKYWNWNESTKQQQQQQAI